MATYDPQHLPDGLNPYRPTDTDVRAVKIDEPFSVTAGPGFDTVDWPAGSWLVQNRLGDTYGMDADGFAANFTRSQPSIADTPLARPVGEDGDTL